MKIKINGIKELDFPKGSTCLEILSSLNSRDKKRPIAAKLNGNLIDLTLPIEGDGSLNAVSFNDEEGKSIYWHSTSHIMAQAVKRLFPDAKLGIGPAISDGFYYDFLIKKTFTPEDLIAIEKKMHKIIDEDIRFERKEISREEALSIFQQRNEMFKVELLNEIEEPVSIYGNEDFSDLCKGPHIPSTGYIGVFKLLSVSGSYWRGDEKRENLQRIYGISFETKEELDAYLKKLEEAKERDHRKIGKELDLFSFNESAGSGLVFWHPKGATLRRIIEDFWKQEHLKNGYELVVTPHIAKAGLWKTSGHYDYYIENMYTFFKNEEEFVVKPMNCPGHILIYQSKMRSYRDLPIRYAELGTVVRDELSGVLQGMLRVREFTVDDGHIFCTDEQIDDEVLNVLKFARSLLETFGFHNLRYELSVRDPNNTDKYAGMDKDWDKAELSLSKALEAEKVDYKRMEGEAVFYGPKIDIKFYDAIGRKWQGPTIQFDFNLPARFDISYIGKDGNPHNVIIVHRALFGSIERFIAVLIENYKGNFPVWLSPIQVKIMTITEKFVSYAQKVTDTLKSNLIRCELDTRNEKINLKIREAEKDKIPYMLILGGNEEKDNTVSVRERHRKNRGAMSIDSLIAEIHELNRRKSGP